MVQRELGQRLQALQEEAQREREAVEALKEADMLIDCVFLLFSPEQMAIQAAGTRVLTAVEPPELLARMLPTKELREKVEIAGELLAQALVRRRMNADARERAPQLCAQAGCQHAQLLLALAASAGQGQWE